MLSFDRRGACGYCLVVLISFSHTFYPSSTCFASLLIVIAFGGGAFVVLDLHSRGIWYELGNVFGSASSYK
jgi:hypothetical protein